jgi:hypothetical protein
MHSNENRGTMKRDIMKSLLTFRFLVEWNTLNDDTGKVIKGG